MGAKLLETNSSPFNKVEVDAVTVDIIENALSNAREEMDAVLFRTAMSPGIREQGDCFPMIANREGKMVVGQFGSFIHGFLEAYEGEIEDGDIIITNDPYLCNAAVSHLPDWIVLVPIFRNGRMLAWSAMFGHMSDNGGMVPGSIPIKAETIFQEGLQIPPTKIYKKGVLQEEILELILRNVRTPQWNRFDLNALIASCRTAAKRCDELAERFGDDVFDTTLGIMLDRNLIAMKAIIHMMVPEGEPCVFEDYICDDGVGMGPYKIKCTMWREGDLAIFDFDGTDPQAKSSVNFYLNEEMFKMFFGSFTINVVDPQIVFNDGFYDLVEVRIPDGCLLKPKYPAALSGRTHALGRIFDVLGALFGQSAPDVLSAAGFSDSPHLFYSGYDDKGEWFQLFQIGFGGIPGRPIGDGPDGHSLWPGFTNVPNEFVEAYFPLRINTYVTIADSGGAGLHRGGNGLNVEYEFLCDGKIAIHDDRWLTYPWGVKGGQPGQRSTKLLVRCDGSEEWLPAKCDDIVVHKGDCLHFNTWGGGGWGDPLLRDPELVLTDVRRQLVSVAGARDYGVVIEGSLDAASLRIDSTATTALRAEMSLARGDTQLFDRGGTIEEIKALCLEQTHLPAPVSPSFNS